MIKVYLIIFLGILLFDALLFKFLFARGCFVQSGR